MAFYLIVGMLGSVIDLMSFFFFQKIGLSVVLSQWFAAFIGSTHNHFWQFYKIFDHNQSFKKTYLLTLILSLLLIFLSGPLLIFIDATINNVLISKLLIFPAIGLAGYLIRKTFIYAYKA